MPIPEPKGSEELQDYMGRCLHALKHEQGGKRWSDHKQRVAVCLTTWGCKKGKVAESDTIMYKYLLNEQKPGTCGIFTGRFQPLHNGHFSIIKAMAQENTLNFVFVVAGAKSSSDKDKNPLSGPERVKLIDSIAPSNVGVLEAKSAYIPDLIKEIESRVMGTKCFQIYAGDDRADSYTRFILKIKEMGYDAIVNTKDYNRAGVSASKVRELMREGNFKEAQKFLPYSVDKIKRFF